MISLDTKPLKLWPHQPIAIEELRDAIRSGHKKLLLQAPTGAGKTIIAAEIIRSADEKGKCSMFLVHRRVLVQQSSNKLHEAGVDHGIIMAGYDPCTRHVQVVSIQTLHSWCVKREILPFPPCDVLIIDECFPAGTSIDGRPIESICVGEFVNSFNDVTGSVERRRVTTTMKNKPSSLVTVHLSSGSRITCTAGHPFKTAFGYTPATSLAAGDQVYEVKAYDNKTEEVRYLREGIHTKELEQPHDANVFTGMQEGGYGQETEKNNCELSLVFGSSCLQWAHPKLQIPYFREVWKGLLFYFMSRFLGSRTAGSEREKVFRVAKNEEAIFRKNEEKKSDERSGNTRENVGHPQKDWTQAKVSRGEWQGAASPPEAAVRRAWLAYGSDCDRWHGDGERISEPLQAGHSGQCQHGVGGGGRRQPLFNKSQRTGPEKGSVLGVSWVDRVEIHEPGSDGGFGTLCPDGSVYNIEVEGNHNYFAEGVLVHNCHRSLSPLYKTIIDHYPNAIVIGLTATPARSDGQGLGDLYETMIQCPSIAELIAQGHLVEPKMYAPTAPDLSGLKVRGGDYIEAEVAAVMDKPMLVGGVVENFGRICPDRKAIAFASSVAHSKHIRDAFLDAGVSAAHVDGETPQDERDEIDAKHRSGEIQVVSNCQVYCEGYDNPAIDCVILARPTKSVVLFLQTIGRGLRTFHGKKDCIVIDHAGAVHEHGFPDEFDNWVLTTGKVAPNTTQVERVKKDAKPITCQNCFTIYKGKPICPNCGTKHEVKGRGVAFVDGQLGEVSRITKATGEVNYSVEQKQHWYSQLLSVADEHLYKEGWAANSYKAKFGVWPNGLTKQRLEPGIEVRGFVKHLQIKFAKQRRVAA